MMGCTYVTTLVVIFHDYLQLSAGLACTCTSQLWPMGHAWVSIGQWKNIEPMILSEIKCIWPLIYGVNEFIKRGLVVGYHIKEEFGNSL